MYQDNPFRLMSIKLLSVALDLLTIGMTFAGLTLIRKALGGEFALSSYFRLWPFLIIFWAVFEKLGLYNGTSIHSGASMGPVEEIRRIFYALTAVFIALGFSNYCYRPDDYLYSRSILLGTFLLCLCLIPANRILLRKFFTRLGIQGVPAVIIGSGTTARTVLNNLNRHPEYGLKPVGYFTNQEYPTMPVETEFLGRLDEIPEQAKALQIKYAILAKDLSPDSARLQEIIHRYGTLFPHLLFVPKTLLNTTSGVIPKDLAGTLGLEIRHNLQIPSVYRIKRVIDYALTLPVLLTALPAMGIIALWIKLDSRGPVFFKHRRRADNGRTLYIYKFRTMQDGASDALDNLLKADPALSGEWEQYGKLEHDPRITKAGAWLRKTSLDELPQLFNVLGGKLTLVGPRPLVKEELAIYGKNAALFDRVLPGLTGLWQVSGRNELTYEQRAQLDLHYVNNWSIWLDLYILSKTVFAVFFRQGAK